MVKKLLDKIQAIILLIAIGLLWIPLTSFGLSHKIAMIIASVLILLNAIGEWF